jgi:uncharacterized protein YqeY
VKPIASFAAEINSRFAGRPPGLIVWLDRPAYGPAGNFMESAMRDRINQAVKDAMLKGEKARLSTLRMVSAAIKNADIEARGQGKEAPGEDALLSLLQKLIKQRQESAELYDKGGRPELAAAERAEIETIQSFLPSQLSEAEIAAAIDKAVNESGAAGPKDMGKVMALLKAAYPGRMDFAKASGAVKKALGG